MASRVLHFSVSKEKAKLTDAERERAHITEFYRLARNRHLVGKAEQTSVTKVLLTESDKSHQSGPRTESPKTEGLNMKLLNTEQAAVYMGVSYSMLVHMRGKGEGPKVTRIGRTVRYREADLQAFLEG
jgi:excisionase family DNA binding protein